MPQRSGVDPFRVAVEAGGRKSAVAPAAPKACRDYAECPNDTICEQDFCQALQSSTNVAWLYYREGTFREVLGLWWSKRGATGFTVLVPLYWHYWSPKGRSHVFAPLFWRFQDYASQHVVMVVAPLFSTSRQPDGDFT